MNKHREKCDHLKEIRKNMAEALGVELNQTVCTFEGDCKGTCPKCQQEEKKLSKALLAGAAVATGAAMMLTGCTKDVGALEGDVVPVAPYEDEIDGGLEELEGEVAYVGESE